MEWNGIFALIYGALGGLFEFLPVSPEVHQEVMGRLCGLTPPDGNLSLAVHIGALLAVLFAYYGKISKLVTEKKIASLPMRQRKRQPDTVSLTEFRLVKTAAIPMVLFCLLSALVQQYLARFWVLIILVILNGVVVLVPQHMTRANKDARATSPLDALLVGLSGMIGALPGFSRMGILFSVGTMRGLGRQFCLDFTFLLAIPWLITLGLIDIGTMLFVGGATFTGATFFQGILACASAFGVGLGGIQLMRFVVVKNDLGGFAYYNWGLAMLAFVIYLIG